MFEKIVVALDHSNHSKGAFAAAGALAKLSGGDVRVVHVREMSIGKTGPIPREEVDEAQVLVDNAVKTLGEQGVNVTGTVRTSHTGRVAAEIVAEAEESGAAVIVMASRGLTDLEGLVMGSVTHKVLHLSKLPVLVVR